MWAAVLHVQGTSLPQCSHCRRHPRRLGQRAVTTHTHPRTCPSLSPRPCSCTAPPRTASRTRRPRGRRICPAGARRSARRPTPPTPCTCRRLAGRARRFSTEPPTCIWWVWVGGCLGQGCLAAMLHRGAAIIPRWRHTCLLAAAVLVKPQPSAAAAAPHVGCPLRRAACGASWRSACTARSRERCAAGAGPAGCRLLPPAALGTAPPQCDPA